MVVRKGFLGHIFFLFFINLFFLSTLMLDVLSRLVAKAKDGVGALPKYPIGLF